ncbi:MAG: glycosyltransferase family 39 protein [Isosphaeraceae bacterium]|nr:glycosyltransferase family 39 protein [Isosphaeraceae bacterium]
MTNERHVARVALLVIAAAMLFGRSASQSSVMFDDGTRYIRQARSIDAGAWGEGLLKAVDHPMYPLSIAAWHRVLGGDSPADWERAGHFASVFAGVLWCIPLYLIALEFYGGASAWIAVAIALILPVTGRVFADVLSESTFQLFWCWGVWCATRFLRQGHFAWIPAAIAFSGLAYLTRPEGLLLPIALVATLMVIPLFRSVHLNWPRWWAAVGFLVIGPALIVGPYVMLEGGLGTKPAVARILGTAPKSSPTAVERKRPLDPDQSIAKTYSDASREVVFAIRDGLTVPLVPFLLAGLAFAWPPSERRRAWILIGMILGASVLALIRLHATAGYCEPRHAMIIIYPLVCLAAFGLESILSRVTIPGRFVGLGEGRYQPGPIVWVAVLGGLALWNAGEIFSSINREKAGYRGAGAYLAEHATAEDRTVDLVGLSLFYGGREGYTFADLHAAPGDPRTRWVVVREAHLRGDWPYCERIREIVGDRLPVATFPEQISKGQAKVLVFRLDRPEASVAARPDAVR